MRVLRTRRLENACPLAATFCLILLLPTAVTAADARKPEVDIEAIFAGTAPKNVADLKAMEEHVRQLSEKVAKCTVGVRVGSAQGSGVIINKEGHVLTAGHVVGKPDRKVDFILPDGKIVKGKTLGVNRGIDSGMMKITDKGEWPFLEMGDSSELKPGQWVLATGHPGGYKPGRTPVVRLGRVLANRDTVVVTDCTLVGGDSGGPLFDMDGKVIAIHSRIGGQLSSNMHVPVKTYQDTWDRLAKSEEWGSFPGNAPFVGVVGDPEAKDCSIAEVYPGTPAAKAGIKQGDIILKFDGKDTPDFPALAGLVREKKPGDKVKIEIKRGEKTLTLTLAVGRRGG
jgi:serine protease Do